MGDLKQGRRGSRTGTAMVLGLLLGFAFGLILNQEAIGALLGLSFGVVVGSVLDA